MARYRTVANQPCFLPVVLSEQLLPGTFEFARFCRRSAAIVTRSSGCSCLYLVVILTPYRLARCCTSDLRPPSLNV
ncbi:hypothetical protein KGA65_15920 [Ideonella sp. B7]|uniref:hypothetical protein n=1 Tax=Ideonella benzenivorans TaxID=2831643 RepID=UPI001CED5A7F|nr:hypothetical protein [Ideonella benzenivorans]MCA6218022.1 hypothetical protein [Ideonella benzenivorans]